jgi:hypothetical protein
MQTSRVTAPVYRDIAAKDTIGVGTCWHLSDKSRKVALKSVQTVVNSDKLMQSAVG